MKERSGMKISTFKERFAMLCEENSGSLTTLADALHVSKQTVSAWRNGTRSPKQPTIIGIAEHFGISIEWLMGFDVERISKKKEQKKIVVPDSDLFRKMIFAMSPSDYETMMQIFERTERKLKERGEL